MDSKRRSVTGEDENGQTESMDTVAHYLSPIQSLQPET